MLPDRRKPSRDGRPVCEETESPLRSDEIVVRKSDDDEFVFSWDALVGVGGGVMAPLSCIFTEACGFKVAVRNGVGESGGVDTVLRVSGLDSVWTGTASRLSSGDAMLVLRYICGFSLVSPVAWIERLDSRWSGKTNCGSLDILVVKVHELSKCFRCD